MRIHDGVGVKHSRSLKWIILLLHIKCHCESVGAHIDAIDTGGLRVKA